MVNVSIKCCFYLKALFKTSNNLAKSSKYLSQEAALSRMQRYCAYQERSHQEVRSKLLDLGVYGDVLEEIMAQLVSDNFLNEERYARAYARGKFRMKQWGRRRIVQELKFRQVSEYCIRKALEEIPEADYQKTLHEVVRKRRESLSPSDNDFTLRQKTAQYVIGRGFEPELVWQAVEAVWGE